MYMYIYIMFKFIGHLICLINMLLLISSLLQSPPSSGSITHKRSNTVHKGSKLGFIVIIIIIIIFSEKKRPFRLPTWALSLSKHSPNMGARFLGPSLKGKIGPKSALPINTIIDKVYYFDLCKKNRYWDLCLYMNQLSQAICNTWAT